MIGIVILNYCSWEDTRKCVQSICKYPPKVPYQIVVVDNASANKPEYDWENFIEKYSVEYVAGNENRGYNAGNNLGIQRALELKCDEILISNSDVRYFENSIQNMWEYLQKHPDVGIVGPKILNVNGELQKVHIFQRTGIKEKYQMRTRANVFFRKKHRAYFGLDKDYEHMEKVYAVLGCCLMMSKECVEKVTPFDEHPFLYEEEFMLGMRMEQAGLETMYLPQAVVEHLHGGSTQNVKAFSFAHFIRSEIYYCREYLHASKAQIYPLYWYRVLLYLGRCVTNEDFRQKWCWARKLWREELSK